jgi:beta-lactam-binding protein with PASTA domain
MPAGQVIDQYPKKDKSAMENSEVELIVAKKRKEVKKESEEIPNDSENGKIEKEIKLDKEKPQDKEIKKDKEKETSKSIPKESGKEKKTKEGTEK